MSADMGFWTESRTAMLRKLHGDGFSGALIATELGCTKGMCSGKISRLGLNNGWIPKIRAPRRNQFSNPLGQKASKPLKGCNAATINTARDAARKPEIRANDPGISMFDPPAPPHVRLVTITQLDWTTCRWPLGDPRDKSFAYCGCTPASGSPYCEYHHRVSYQGA